MQPQDIQPCVEGANWPAIIAAVGGIVASSLAAILAYLTVRGEKRAAHRWTILQLKWAHQFERDYELDARQAELGTVRQHNNTGHKLDSL